MRLYALAKELDCSSQVLRAYLTKIGHPLHHASCNVPAVVVDLARNADQRELRGCPGRMLGDSFAAPWPQLLNTQQAALLAQVRPATIRQWVHRGHLRAADLRGYSRTSFFNLADVIAARDATKQRRKEAVPNYWEPILTHWNRDAVVTTKQASAYLRIPEPTIRSWVQRGRLIPVDHRGRTPLLRLVHIYALLLRRPQFDDQKYLDDWD